MIDSIEDLIERLQISLGTSKTLLSEEEFDFAVSQAQNEMRLKFPIVDGKRQLWGIERSKRHALDLLRIQSAHRFKYKQLSLNDRFNHYDRMIKDMDEKFEHAMNSDPDLWDIAPEGMLGFYVDNGFVYNKYGEDMTKFIHTLVTK